VEQHGEEFIIGRREWRRLAATGSLLQPKGGSSGGSGGARALQHPEIQAPLTTPPTPPKKIEGRGDERDSILPLPLGTTLLCYWKEVSKKEESIMVNALLC